jgi:hypothetical protein
MSVVGVPPMVSSLSLFLPPPRFPLLPSLLGVEHYPLFYLPKGGSEVISTGFAHLLQ